MTADKSTLSAKCGLKSDMINSTFDMLKRGWNWEYTFNRVSLKINGPDAENKEG